MRSIKRMVLVLFVYGLATIPGYAQTLPPGFQQSVVFSGLNQPTSIEFAADGSIFVAEKSGVIKLFSSLSDPSPTIFADLSTQVHNFWDRGLLGLAVHPSYPIEPYVYVLYTLDAPIGGTPPVYGDACSDPTGQGCMVGSRLSRLTASGGVLVGGEEIFIEDWCQQYPSHSIGGLDFGPDGALYLTAGDGASFNFVDSGQSGNPCGDPFEEGGALRSQDLEGSGDPLGYNGAVLRLDPYTGEAATDNPLIGGDPTDDRIIAYGLRNPFRLTVHPEFGEVWIGDVGWGTYEEINRIIDPLDAEIENFGWPCYEGSPSHGGYAPLPLCQALYATGTAVEPHYEYEHSEQIAPGGCPVGTSAISGLAFYTGGTYPAEYDDCLFFTDYSRQCIWVMFADGTGVPDPTDRQTFIGSAGPIVDLEIGPGGDLFYVNLDGTIHRVQDLIGSQPPMVELEAGPISGPAPLTVDFDASSSYDPDPGDTISFAWDLDGDGAFDDGTAPEVSYSYLISGSYLASVQVTDDNGVSSFDSVTITVDNAAPDVSILLPDPATEWRVGDEIEFLAFATDPDTGAFDPEGLHWEVILHHCHVHDPSDCHEHFVLEFPGVDSGVVFAPDHSYPSYLEFRVTATDDGVADWALSEWNRRRQIQIDNSQQSQDLEEMPVMVQLDLTQLTGVASDVSDIRFVDSDGQLILHEIDSIEPGLSATAWVRVPHIPAASTTDTFWLYYGNPSATDAQSSDVWSTGYVGVWHLTTLEDSTSYGNDLTNFGAASVNGRIGTARDFDGSTSYLDAGSDASLALSDEVTLEAWVQIDSPDSGEFMRVLSKKSLWSATNGYSLRYNAGADRLSILGSGANVGDATAVDLDLEWHYAAATIIGAQARVYLDGVDVTTDFEVNPLISGTPDLHIGKRSGGGNYFDGRIDEPRVSNVARSADWIRAQHLAMTGQYLTMGAEQTSGSLSTTESVLLYPESVANDFETVPAGLQLSVGEVTGPAPFTHEAIIGSVVSMTATSPQQLGGATYEFSAWSDGGAQIHEFTAGETSQTFIATFTSTAGSEFNRGDTNGDQDLNIADAILALDYLFGTTAVDCLDAVDANDDGTLDVADVITLLGYLFQAGSPLPPPFGVVPEDCGADPTDDALDCVMPNCG